MSRRYEVEVIRKVIVYAGGPKSAARRAKLWADGDNVSIGKVVRLSMPQDEEQKPIIDRAPSRETRK